jgi:hypothetical protein
MITLDRIRELCVQFGYKPFDNAPDEYHIGESSVFKVLPNEPDRLNVVYWDTMYSLGTRYSNTDLTEEKVIEMIQVNLKCVQKHEEMRKKRLEHRMLSSIQGDFE